jgi:putative oxidoreductase
MKFTRSDLALLALRLVLGVAFVVHGYPKIQHPLTWAAHALPGAPGWLAAVSAAIEFGGGIALIAGFLTRVVAFLIAADMVVAIFFALVPHGAPFVAESGGPSFELPLTYLVVGFALVMLGAGAISLDGLREGDRRGGKIGTRTRPR